MTALTAALAGANMMYGAGMLDSGMILDPAQLVVDDETAAMVRRFVGGVAVNDETLRLDEIHAVGCAGDFLESEYTLAHMHDCSAPRIFDRRNYEQWEQSGKTDAYMKGAARAREILADHKPEPLDADVDRQLQAIVEKYDAMAAAGLTEAPAV
jgi:trimethylamine--corrinoid protein Co-methyltransferase